MYRLSTRIEKIERQVGCDNKASLRLPDPHNEGKFIEIKGVRTLAEAMHLLHKQEAENA